jgi:hypothetical protein
MGMPSDVLMRRAPGPLRGRPAQGRERMEARLNVRLAVNGTLMRGLALNGNLLAVGATFHREATTIPTYRLWSIGIDIPR